MKKIVPLLLVLNFSFFASCGEGPRPTSTYSYAGDKNSDGKPDQHKIKIKNGVHLTDYKKSFYDLYSINSDISLGEQVMKEQIKEFNKKNVAVDPAKEAALKTRIEGIVKKLAAVSDHPNFPYEVHIFDKTDVVNAFCMPGGKIGVFTGLFDEKKGLIDKNSDDEIAAVLGHEMAHANMRHVTRQVSKMQSFGFLGQIASVAIGQTAGLDWQRGFETVLSYGVNLYMPSYTRSFEREADQVGFYYMAKAGFKPEAAIDVWKRAAKRKDGNNSSFFSSHPSNGERAANLEGWLAEAHAVQNKTQK